MNARQRRVFNTLRRLDSFLADHYKSAILLLDRRGPVNLKNAAHAIREMVNSLFDVLGIPNERDNTINALSGLQLQWPMPVRLEASSLSDEPTTSPQYEKLEVDQDTLIKTALALRGLKKDNNKSRIRQLTVKVDAFNVTEIRGATEPTVKKLLEVTGWFVACSHHRGTLGGLKKKRRTFKKNLRLVEDTILALFSPFYETLGELRSLSLNAPTKENVARVTLLLQKAHLVFKWFSVLKNPAWFAPMKKAGFFSNPPGQQSDGKTIFSPPWPPTPYLKFMASKNPARVVEVIKEVGATNNLFVQLEVTEASLLMPTKYLSLVVPVFIDWQKQPGNFRLPLLLGKVVTRLASRKYYSIASDLFRELLEMPINETNARRSTTDDWTYEQLLGEPLSALAKIHGLETLSTLSEILLKTLEGEYGAAAEIEDFSYIWKKDLARSIYREESKNLLAEAVKNLSERLFQNNPRLLEQIIEVLENKKPNIFKRISFDLLAQAPKRVETHSAPRLCNEENFRNDSLRDEYDKLLKSSWQYLREADQKKVLNFIDKPLPDKEKLIDDFTPRLGHEGAKRRVEEYEDRQRYVRLIPIKDFLRGPWLTKFQSLDTRFDPPAPLEEYAHDAVTSPSSSDDLSAMGIEKTIEYLRTWGPPRGITTQSRSGLGMSFQGYVSTSPKLWSDYAKDINSVHPIFVRFYIEGLEKGVYEGAETLNWEKLLEFLNTFLAGSYNFRGEHSEYDDTNQGSARMAILRLLRKSLATKGVLNISLREKIWAVLEKMKDDPDPTPQQEQDIIKRSRDPITLALNSVRGEHMMVVVEFALWVARNLKSVGQLPKEWIDVIPEAKEVFEEKLLPTKEPSLAVRANYGQYFANLHYLGPGWLGSLIPKIFSDSNPSLRNAAFHTFVFASPIYEETTVLMLEIYSTYTENMLDEGYWPNDSREEKNRFSEHIILIYGHYANKVNGAEDLLKRFYAKANLVTRSHALHFFGQHLSDLGSKADEVLIDRYKALIEDRTKAVESGSEASELEEFGACFYQPVASWTWLLSTAQKVLKLTNGQISEEHIFSEKLGDVADHYPLEAVKCLQLVAQGNFKYWSIHSWKEGAEKVLIAAFKAGEPSASIARDTINSFGEKGFDDFSHLLNS